VVTAQTAAAPALAPPADPGPATTTRLPLSADGVMVARTAGTWAAVKNVASGRVVLRPDDRGPLHAHPEDLSACARVAAAAAFTHGAVVACHQRGGGRRRRGPGSRMGRSGCQGFWTTPVVMPCGFWICPMRWNTARQRGGPSGERRVRSSGPGGGVKPRRSRRTAPPRCCASCGACRSDRGAVDVFRTPPSSDDVPGLCGGGVVGGQRNGGARAQTGGGSAAEGGRDALEAGARQPVVRAADGGGQ